MRFVAHVRWMASRPVECVVSLIPCHAWCAKCRWYEKLIEWMFLWDALRGSDMLRRWELWQMRPAWVTWLPVCPKLCSSNNGSRKYRTKHSIISSFRMHPFASTGCGSCPTTCRLHCNDVAKQPQIDTDVHREAERAEHTRNFRSWSLWNAHMLFVSWGVSWAHLALKVTLLSGAQSSKWTKRNISHVFFHHSHQWRKGLFFLFTSRQLLWLLQPGAART